jgi:predicted peroxiredoxin
MNKVLLIHSKSPWESAQHQYVYGLARDLAAAGSDVTLYLVQNGVMPARKGAKATGLGLKDLVGKVKILADDFSLRERSIQSADLIDGVKSSSIDVVTDLLAEGAKAIWQ